MMMRLLPFPLQPSAREWQLRGMTAYARAALKNFLAYVTPGAGKTYFSLRIVHDLLSADECRDTAVVVHTNHLREQWLAAAEWANVPMTVWTYQQIAADPAWVRSETTRSRRALVIFDEVHHAADKQQWGDGLAYAFQDAHRRLLLTGTPFRHDEKRIRYVRYEQGVGQSDFVYSYADALRDGIVRPVFFPLIGGQAKWKIGDDEFTGLFGGKVNRADASRLLRSAINPGSGWLRDVIGHAHARLLEVRETHPDAGGLIVAQDQDHAERVARLVGRVTGTKADVAISNYADASRRITAFKESDTHWLVAVRMISEGVDIPRLRVGIYATNVVTELFFRQWVGRYVRVMPGLEEQSAYLYLPNDPALTGFARALAEERRHVLRAQETATREGAPRAAASALSIELLEATAAIGDVIAGGETFSQEELQAAAAMKAQLGLGYLPNEVVAKIMRAMRAQPEPQVDPLQGAI
ncbi:MAG: DEAD/DEAH box helicase family protein [Anaerolineae bacterium]